MDNFLLNAGVSPSICFDSFNELEKQQKTLLSGKDDGYVKKLRTKETMVC